MVHPQSMLQIQGKTNVNSFQCYCAPPASVVGFNAESSSETQKINFKKAELTVLTKSLDCKHKIMNRDMYQTLKAEHYPTITQHKCALETGRSVNYGSLFDIGRNETKDRFASYYFTTN